jgi:hypothetical protein
LTSMEREGLIHCLVQQNHDGLPQKVWSERTTDLEVEGVCLSWLNSFNLKEDYVNNLEWFSSK